MPNLAKLYTQLTKNPIESDTPLKEIDPAADAARQQSLSNWKNATITREKVAEYQDEIVKLVKQSVELALSFPQHGNPHKIIQNLIKIDTLTKIVNSYE